MSEEKSPADPKSARMLQPQDMGLAEERRQDFIVEAEPGTTVEEVLRPEYWSHVSTRMQQFDTVEVRPPTGEWLVKLRVLNTGRNWAQMFLEHKYDLEQRSEAPVAKLHTVEWKGPQRKHAVIRIADSQLIQDGFSSKAEAEVWLANHERTVG